MRIRHNPRHAAVLPATLTVAIAAAIAILLPFIVAGCGGGSGPSATGAIQGKVTLAGVGSPIPGVLVALGSGQSQFTSADGRFNLTGVPAKRQSISAAKPGFGTWQGYADVHARQSITCDIQLGTSSPMVAGRATLANYYNPAAAGSASRRAPAPSPTTRALGSSLLGSTTIDRIQVQLRSGLSVADAKAELTHAGYEVVDVLPLSGIIVVRPLGSSGNAGGARLPGGSPTPGDATGRSSASPGSSAWPSPSAPRAISDLTPEHSAAALEMLSSVEWAIPDSPMYATAIPNDPMYAEFQWHYRAISLPYAWDLATGIERDVVIAVIDTGVSMTHPDLQGKLVPGWDFIGDDPDPQDEPDPGKYSHGTHVAGTIAAATNNGIGVAGVSWGASLMPIRVLNGNGDGANSLVAEAIRWAVDHGADIINLSLGGPDDGSGVVKAAVDYAYSRGVTVVAAAGNESSSRVLYPAAYPTVIAVSATGLANEFASYSNYGPDITVAAPGGTGFDPVFSTSFYNGAGGGNIYSWMCGTSMAAPHVSGLIGLILARFGPMTPDSVASLITSTSMDLGQPGRDDDFGAGLVNAHAALTRSTMDRAVFAIMDQEGHAISQSVYGNLDRTFEIRNSPSGAHTLTGWLDSNESGTLDRGDYYGSAPITIPASGAVLAPMLTLTYVDNANTGAKVAVHQTPAP